MKTQTFSRVTYSASLVSFFLLPWFLVCPLFFINLYDRIHAAQVTLLMLPIDIITTQNALYVLATIGFLGYLYHRVLANQEKHTLFINDLKTIIDAATWSLVFLVIFEFGFSILPMMFSWHLTSLTVLATTIKYHQVIFLPLCVLALFLSGFRTVIKKSD